MLRPDALMLSLMSLNDIEEGLVSHLGTKPGISFLYLTISSSERARSSCALSCSAKNLSMPTATRPNFVLWRSFAPELWTLPNKCKGFSWVTSFVFNWLARRVPDNYLLNEHKNLTPCVSGKWSISAVAAPSVIYPSGGSMGGPLKRMSGRATSLFAPVRRGDFAFLRPIHRDHGRRRFWSRTLTHARACHACSG